MAARLGMRGTRKLSMIHEAHQDCPSSLSCPPFGFMCQHRSVSMASIGSDATTLSCNEQTYPHMHPLSDKFRRKIRVFKMNPIEKWRYEGRIPWKLILQAAKIVFVTIQLIVYGNRINRHFKHHGNTLALMKEMFLPEADLTLDLQPYPPNFPQAVHNRAEFYEHVNKAISVYSTIDRGSFGVYDFGEHVSAMNPMSPLTFCYDSYDYASMDPSEFFYNYSQSFMQHCIDISNDSWLPGNPVGHCANESAFSDTCPFRNSNAGQVWLNFSIQQFLKDQNRMINFRALSQAVLSFPVRAVFVNSLSIDDPPDCYEFIVRILYDNSLRDGRMTVSLDTESHQKVCKGEKISLVTMRTQRYILNIVVLLICSISCLSSLKSLIYAFLLYQETDRYFERYFRQSMSLSERIFFVEFWIVFTVLNDCLIIAATSIKLLLEKRIYESSYFFTCSMLMGIGVLLAWFSILRYLSYFNKYNILILAIRSGIPYILRFMTTTMLIYGGYVLCGWLVLSPFHLKFRHLSTTSEALFSLAQGDDMFVTFENLNAKDDIVVWYFCRCYIYSFVIMFMYIIASQVVAIFSLSFDTINCYYANGFPLSPLQVRFWREIRLF